MLSRGKRLALVRKVIQRAAEPGSRLPRPNDSVNVSERSRLIGVGETRSIFGNVLRARRLRIRRFGNFTPKDDVHRAFGSHHSDLSGWVRQIEIRTDVF